MHKREEILMNSLEIMAIVTAIVVIVVVVVDAAIK